IRKGWDDSHITAFEVARGAQEVGVQAISIHARTSKQMYSGTADWGFIRDLKRELSIPLIGNGDIDSPAQANRCLRETGCDAVMIGRASRGNPWIFREAWDQYRTGQPCPPPTMEEKKAIMLEHLEMVIREHGEGFGVPEMRKFLAWYTRGLPSSAKFREQVNKVTTVDAMERLLDDYMTVQSA
ncbi:MAG: tRNA dihydrouridine synthase, partial [Candidatus Xenobia bacterium]